MVRNSKIVTIRRAEDDGDRGAMGADETRAAASAGTLAHSSPSAPTLPRLPAMIADEILDFYGWLFCQGGFRNLQMTFEQFLTVVATVKPALLHPEGDPDDIHL